MPTAAQRSLGLNGTCISLSESRRRNLEDPDFTLRVRVQDLAGESENALSAIANVHIAVQQNLWVSPGQITIKEHLETSYPMVIAKVRGIHFILQCKSHKVSSIKCTYSSHRSKYSWLKVSPCSLTSSLSLNSRSSPTTTTLFTGWCRRKGLLGSPSPSPWMERYS